MLNLARTLTAEQRLQKATIDIIHNPRYAALAGVLMIGNREISDECPTAMTNGRDEVYGRAFVDGLSDPELRFLVLHENFHKLYKHLTTWRWMYDEDPATANKACDYVINCKILDENPDGFAKMPTDSEGKTMGLFDAKYRDKDSAEVYADIRKNGNDDDDGEGGAGGEGSLDQHDWEGAKELTEEEKRELARDIDEAVRQGALLAGKTGSGGLRDAGELLQPQVNWRDALREFVTTTCAGNDFSTWKRPNRRFIGSGIYMPSSLSETADELVLAIDTSYSIGQREISMFLSEIKLLSETVKPRKVRLLYWDTKVSSEEVYEGGDVNNIAESTKPSGGGGTDVVCVERYLKENNINPTAIVVLTDGYLGGDWGNWDAPILWCLLDNKKAKPPIGSSVHIKSYEM
jgi:predicted metal-dependent peptidase